MNSMQSSESTPRFSLRTLLVLLTVFCLLVGLVGVRIKRAQQEHARQNHLKQIALAFINYHDIHGCFPPAQVLDGNGKPMHSWRVLLLEVMPDQQSQQLFKKYDFSKPWDSPANKALAAEIPDVYANPFALGSSQNTSYMVVTGPDTLFDRQKSISFRDITDGTSNTLLVAEVANSKTLWTEPHDLDVNTMPRDFDPSKQAECISGLHAGTVLLATADGAVHSLDLALPAKALRQLFIRNDGEPFGCDFLEFVL